LFVKIFNCLNKMGLRNKFIIGYIIIIMIPSTLLGTFIYKRFYDSMLNEYVNQKQNILYEYYFSMEKDLAKIHDIYSLFQYNTNIIDYLDGNHNSNLDSVYIFSKYIKQLYGYAYSSMPYIKNINIYKNNEKAFTIPPLIVNKDTFDNDKVILDKLTVGKGEWTVQKSDKGALPDIKYYQKIFNNDFDKELGILEVLPSAEIISNYINNIKHMSMGNNTIYLVDMNNDVLYKTGKNISTSNDDILDKLLQQAESDGYFHIDHDGKKVIGNVTYIKTLNMKMITFEDETYALNNLKVKKSTILLYIIIFFLVLSAIYYFIATNITSRVLKLANHMRNVDQRNISLYRGKSGKDEIGFLIDSYNSMIMRIDELVNTVYKAEMLRKEAIYAALQAKIRPHFLFGTLESIRMLAESNKDFDVSNIIFTFGKLMRYSISSSKNEVFLKEEIENVKNYLKIQKMRMGDRLHFEFNIKPNIDAFLCPQFILQPLVENCIVHGISKCRGRGFIKISIVRDEEYIIITIYDNGYGISAKALLVIQNVLENKIDIKDFQTKNAGFGVYSVSERIKSYYGKNSRLVITSVANEGSTCTLYLYRYKGDVKDENNGG